MGRACADLAGVGDVVDQTHGLEEVQVDLYRPSAAISHPHQRGRQGVDGTVHVVFGDAEVGVQPQTRNSVRLKSPLMYWKMQRAASISGCQTTAEHHAR